MSKEIARISELSLAREFLWILSLRVYELGARAAGSRLRLTTLVWGRNRYGVARFVLKVNEAGKLTFKLTGKLKDLDVDDGHMKRMEAIVLSMTTKERTRPEMLNPSRRGKGVSSMIRAEMSSPSAFNCRAIS